MNIPYLLKCIDTDQLAELVAVMDLVPLDMNLELDEAVDRGEIEINGEEGTVKLLAKSVDPYHEPDLTGKLVRTMQHYAKNKTIISRGRINTLYRDPVTGAGYPHHDFIMSMQYLIDTGAVIEYPVHIPEGKKTVTNKKGKQVEAKTNPEKDFIFLGLAENKDDNQKWIDESVKQWIENFEKAQ